MDLSTFGIDLGDIAIRCDEAGEGERPFVLLHGLTGHRKDFDRVLVPLSVHGRILAPDLRGHGDCSKRHTPETYCFESMIDDQCRLLDKLGVEKVDLLGHSFGGMLALRFTLAHADRVASLMLMSTSSEAPDGYTPETFVKAGGFATSKGMEQMQARLEELGRANEKPLGDDASADQHDWQVRYWAHHKLRLCAMDPNAYGALGVLMMTQDPVTERLSEITCPTTVLVGSEDEEFVRGAAALPEGLSAASPDVAYCVMPGVGHQPHQESVDAFLKTVAEHLERARSAS